MSNNQYVIQVRYTGNPDLLAGEITTTYLASIGPIPGGFTNYSSLFTSGSAGRPTKDKPHLFDNLQKAKLTCDNLQEHLDGIKEALNMPIRTKPGPHPNYYEFFTRVVLWDEFKFIAEIDEHNYFKDQKAVAKRIRERQLFRSRKNDKPIVDDLDDYT